MNIKLISGIAVSLFLLSCVNSSNEKSKEQTEIIIPEEHQHDTATQTIELNNGGKWKVKDEMMLPIRNMEKDMNDFSLSKTKDYKSLSEKLQTNIGVLVSSCTMSGKAHDELHKWLVPYIDMVKDLSEEKSEAEAAKKFENIQTSFITFNKYFE